MRRQDKGSVHVALISDAGQFSGNVTVARVAPLLNVAPLIGSLRARLARTLRVPERACTFSFAYEGDRLQVRLAIDARVRAALDTSVDASAWDDIGADIDAAVCTRLSALAQPRDA